MMKKFHIYRFFALLLALIMFVQLLPVQILAQAVDENPPTEVAVSSSAGKADAASVQENGQIVEEVTEKRTEHTKQFLLNNGLSMAVVYPEAVHYRDSGQWKEIDNTLKRTGAAYTNTAGGWQISLPEKIGGKEAVTVSKDGYTLQFYMAGELQENTAPITTGKQEPELRPAGNAPAQVAQIDMTEALEAAQHPETVPEKLQSRLQYTDVYPGTDIVYDLHSNKLKESIVIEAYSQTLRGYRYILKTGDLTPVLKETGGIELYGADKTKPIMVMPAPYMLDAGNAYTEDIDVALTGENGTYLLTYLLPTQWLAEKSRQWPVILDPVVTTNIDTGNIKDISLYERNAYPNHLSGVLECGVTSEFGLSRAFMQYVDLPDLTSSDVVISASLRLCKASNSAGATIVEVHKITEAWNNQTVTWDTQPSYERRAEDFANVQAAGYYFWDITDVVQGWYTGGNTGLAITMPKALEDAEYEYDIRKQFWSSDYDIYQISEKPTVTIVFRNNNGIESYWDYTGASAGRAGSGYVNNYTGNLAWVHSDIGFGGNRMPVSISHIYNLNDVITPSDSNNSNDSAGNAFGLGTGWRTNFNQLLYAWEIDGTARNYYVWEDSDGTDHYFTADEEGVIRDEDGLELTLTATGTGTEKYCITDKHGNRSYFDTQGRLTRIENNQQQKSSITVAYTSDSSKNISFITDGANRKYSFIYGTDGLLSKISYLGTGTTEISHVSFSYTGTKLTGITDRDGKTVTYTYDSNNLLTAAQDIDGYKLSYSYNSVPAAEPWRPYRVLSVAESYNGTLGGGVSFTYGHNQTTISDHNGNKSILQFNNFGNLTCIQDDEGRAQFAEYAFNTDAEKADNTDATAKGNQLRVSSDLQYTVANLMSDNNMRFTSLSWSPYRFAEKTLTTSRCYADLSALQVNAGGDAENDSGIYSGPFTVKAGQTQTFSCYVASYSSVYLMAVSNSKTVTSETQPTDNQWYRLQVSYTNDTDQDQTVTYYVATNAMDFFYMDCPQLENAPTSSRYNLINNGDFNNPTDMYRWTGKGLTAGDHVVSLTASSAVPQLDNRVLTIHGDPLAEKRLTQTVFVDGNAGDYYTVCGWAMGDAAPLSAFDANPREFAIEAVILYADGTKSEPFTARFNTDSRDWQFAATGIFAEKEFWKIDVSLIYSYNTNWVYFDGIQLYKDGFGAKLEYDEDGNVISVRAANNKTDRYEYTNNNLTRQVMATGSELTYTYDSYHNVKTATTEEGLVYQFAYDGWGNNTAVSIGDGTDTVTASAAYSSDGNLLVSTTDALGNLTSYGYNADTNLLTWVQYPKDTENTRTEYGYDSIYRLTSAAAATDTGLSLSAAYAYGNDLLTAVETPTTAYSFTYGTFGLRSSVKIGARTLASYSYTADRNFYLSALDYGNGDKIQYTYDDKGRVLTAVYEDGNTVAYSYDNSGRVATVTDSASGTVTAKGYDYIDRISLYREENDDNTLSLSYSYYVSNKKLKTLLEEINGHPRGASYIYDEDERLSSYQKANGKRAYTYDDFDRVPSYVTTHKNGTGAFDTVLTTAFTYASSAASTTSRRVASMTQAGTGFSNTWSYTYDANGNILSVSDGTSTTTYAYDSANQLIRENNQAGGFTHVWTYDDGGNLLSRAEYPYTAGQLGTATDTVLYTYGDAGWGDLLTAYDGAAISYDGIGNPLSDGIRTYTWQHGRQLASLTAAESTWQFTYNADGLRTKRTDGTDTYEYVYYGGLLQYMEYNNTPVYFTHAPDGTAMGMLTGGQAYFYVTNLQGDVVGIVDATGNLQVSYTYDAWGKPLTVTGPMAATVGALNPLRYRGYVYDAETGLYYLQSRYYNPETGRFINADGYATTGQGFLGNNMFAYCNNNPINMIDSAGCLPEWIKGLVKWYVSAIIMPKVEYIEETWAEESFTYSVGIGASVTPTGILYGAQGSIAIDSTGDVIVQTSTGVGFTTGTPGGSVMLTQSVTNAPSVDSLTDMGTQIGFSAGIPVYGVPLAVGGDVLFIPVADSDKAYMGVSTGIGLGTPGAEFHVEITDTTNYQKTKFNLFDKIEEYYNLLMGW